MADIVRRVDQGEALATAMEAQHGYFPRLATEMTHVGEQTGQLDRVLLQLAEHYENLLGLRRVFLVGLWWPALQLLLALSVVGFLIWLMGVIPFTTLDGVPVDVLGLGLQGNVGVLIYVAVLTTLAALLAGSIFAISRGWLWTGALMPLLMKTPGLGPCLKYSALSRLSWALGMGIDAGMAATQALKLALGASQNVYFSALWPRVEQSMERRCPMSEALRETGRFPHDFLLTLETGELSGMITETLARQAQEYRDRAQAWMRTLTTVAGFACALGVGVLIIYLVVRLFIVAYLGPIYEAIELTK
jgi:type II secretory pathway component PulF